ncbi:MAG: hypothetical protein ACTHN5_11225 [Phycisphaerae bacterium]
MKLQIQNRKLKAGNNRGTALMAAILMMVFIAAAVTAMTTVFTHEAKRTRLSIADAQLRQLLLAADPAAREELARNSSPHDLTLPIPVPDATLTLHIETSHNNAATIRATARLPQNTLTATTTYTRTGNSWSPDSTTLAGL